MTQYVNSLTDKTPHTPEAARWRSIRTIQGSVIVFSRNRSGSQLLQQLLETDALAAEVIFEELNAFSLKSAVMDCMGSFLMMKLIDVASKPIATAIMNALLPHFRELSLHPVGSQVVQHMIAQPEDRYDLFLIAKALSGSLAQCMQDEHASTVVVKLLYACPKWGIKVLNAIAGSLNLIACDTHGWRVVALLFEQFTYQTNIPAVSVSAACQILTTAPSASGRVVPMSTISEEARRTMGVDLLPLSHKIVRQAKHFVFNEYGVHAVQSVMMNVPAPFQRRFIEVLVPLVPKLSRSRIGVQIVESLSKIATSDEHSHLIELLAEGSPPTIVWMLQTSFAKQTAHLIMERCCDSARQVINAAVNAWIHSVSLPGNHQRMSSVLGVHCGLPNTKDGCHRQHPAQIPHSAFSLVDDGFCQNRVVSLPPPPPPPVPLDIAPSPVSSSWLQVRPRVPQIPLPIDP